MTRSSQSQPDPAVALLRDIARTPRPTGSDALAAARARVRRELESFGFEARDLPFEFSTLPGRFATPAFGAAVAAIAATAGHLGSRGGQGAPLGILVAGMVILLVAGSWIARRGTLAISAGRARGINTEYTRPGRPRPRVWLCAHLDTKSQPVPSLVRAAGIAVAVTGVVALLALSVAAAAGARAPFLGWAIATAVTLAGCIPVMLSMVGSRSPGALDNASGVVAVVEAARLVRGRDVGILVTDAEELALAGAHAWAASGAGAGATVLNCDGVDDAGENLVMYARRAPQALVDAARRGARESGIAFRARPLPLGVLTDSVAFTTAGVASVTFSRGSHGSLARVHSAGDDLSRLAGTGIAEVARLMASTVVQID